MSVCNSNKNTCRSGNLMLSKPNSQSRVPSSIRGGKTPKNISRYPSSSKKHAKEDLLVKQNTIFKNKDQGFNIMKQEESKRSKEEEKR